MELDRPPPVARASNFGLHTPVSHRLFCLMLCSTLGSLAVLLTNHPPRFRRVDRATPAKKAPHNPTVMVTDVMAAVSLLNGLLSFFAPVHVMTVQVPHGVYAVAEPVDIPSTSFGFAVAFALLTAGALAASSTHIWSCYTLGCRIAGGAPPAPWKTWTFAVFEFLFIVLWFGSHVNNQYRLRALPFHSFFGVHTTRFYTAFGVGVALGLAHIIVNLVMLLVFARSINVLAEQTQILDAQRVGDLQSLAVKTMWYIAGNILLFVFLWFCLVVYPLNLRLAETIVIYHLALLLLLHLCFNVRGLPLRRAPPSEHNKDAGAGGINAPLPPPDHEFWAPAQPPQPPQPQQGGGGGGGDGVEMVAGPPRSPSGSGRRGRGLFQRRAVAATAAAGGGGGGGIGYRSPSTINRSPHSGGVDAEGGAAAAAAASETKAPWTPPRTRGEIPLPSPLEAGYSPRPDEKKAEEGGESDAAQEQQRRRRQRRRPWTMWELPEVTHVFPNPWDYSRGVVFRISERVRSLSTRGDRGATQASAASAAAAAAGGATAAIASATSVGASSVGSGGGSGSVAAMHPYQQQHALQLQLEGVEEEGEGQGSSVVPTPVSRRGGEEEEGEAGTAGVGTGGSMSS